MHPSHRLSLIVTFVGLTAAATTARAGLNTYYQEDFAGQTGQGITDPGEYNANPNWSVDGTNASATMGHARVTQSPEEFEFLDLGGTPDSPAIGSAELLTTEVVMSIGNPGYFSYLTMTLDATLNRNAADILERLVIESLIDGMVVETTTLTMLGDHDVVHNLLPYVSANTMHDYQLRITANQVATGTPNFRVDNILVEGLSVPEPASMSMLGMGVAAMCTAGYRRRRRATAQISG